MSRDECLNERERDVRSGFASEIGWCHKHGGEAGAERPNTHCKHGNRRDPGACPACPEPCELCDGTGRGDEFAESAIAWLKDSKPLCAVSTAYAEEADCPQCTPVEPDPDEKYDRMREER